MFTFKAINMLLLVVTSFLVNFREEVKGQVMHDCQPSRNCLTCTGVPYNCASCRKGYFFARGGAYFECRPCPPECSECDYYSMCTVCVEKNHYGNDCKSVVCSKGCLNSTCNVASGTCLCTENYEGGHCDYCAKGKYGFESNCTLDCPYNCLRCSSNETCTECKDGFYGNACNLSCPRGCLTDTCYKNNGTCFDDKCKPNFNTTDCDHCAQGFYGNDCESTCPANCDKCSSDTSCDTCKDGFWGGACQHNCSSGCVGGRCFKQTGNCENKCRSGFVGRKCDSCRPGHFGLNCSISHTAAKDFGMGSSASNVHLHLCVVVFSVLYTL